jgi:hypothetical protein
MGKSQPTDTRECKQDIFLRRVEKAKRKEQEILACPIVLGTKGVRECGEQGEDAFPGKGHQSALVRAKIASEDENMKF